MQARSAAPWETRAPPVIRWDARGLETAEHGKNEGFDMPRYEFMCEKCNKPFEAIMTFSEREKGEVQCPKCHGTKVRPQLSGGVAQTGKKS